MLEEYIDNQNKDINITTNEDSSSHNDTNYSYRPVEEKRLELSLENNNYNPHIVDGKLYEFLGDGSLLKEGVRRIFNNLVIV